MKTKLILKLLLKLTMLTEPVLVLSEQVKQKDSTEALYFEQTTTSLS